MSTFNDDFVARSRRKPFAHQIEDTITLLKHPYFLVASEMRTGKSKILIDAAQVMFVNDVIDRVIVVAPEPARDGVWFNRELGQLGQHLWEGLHARVSEYHRKIRQWTNPGSEAKPLSWIITNYEFIARSEERLSVLLNYCGPRTMLVCDESMYVKNHKSKQTKACMQLRYFCRGVWEMNGTPIFHTPLDLFSQGNLLHPSVLDCKYITHFKARYAIQEAVKGYGGRVLTDTRGNAIQTIKGWKNLEDLQQRFAPYTVRRLQKDCLDLPPKLDPVNLTATLTPKTWRIYKDMRDEAVVELQRGVASAAQASIKVMRLSQITSGLLGGVEADLLDDTVFNMPPRAPSVEHIGSEKLDVLLWFLEQQFEREEKPKIVVWCRFRNELFRTIGAVGVKFPQFVIGSIQGGQKKGERQDALRLLKPETSPDKPVFVCGIIGSGSFGLDFAASHTCVNLSSDYSPGKFAQANDRVYGPGQKFPIAYYNIVATGPAGQKTIDHTIFAARTAGENIASWTSSAWIRALKEE